MTFLHLLQPPCRVFKVRLSDDFRSVPDGEQGSVVDQIPQIRAAAVTCSRFGCEPRPIDDVAGNTTCVELKDVATAFLVGVCLCGRSRMGREGTRGILEHWPVIIIW